MKARSQKCRHIVLAFAVGGCGETTYRAERFEPVEKPAEGAPSLAVGVKQTRKGTGFMSEAYFVGAPYTARVVFNSPDGSTEPFEVRSIAYELEGKRVVALSPEEPLQANVDTSRSKPLIDASAPMPDLEFVEGAELVLEAEVKMPGAEWRTIRRSFVGKAKDERLVGCDRIAMY